MVSVHPARRCTSPLGVGPAGLVDGVGDCYDVANLPGNCLFISLFYLGGINLTFLNGYDFWFFFTAVYASSKEGAHSMLP